MTSDVQYQQQGIIGVMENPCAALLQIIQFAGQCLRKLDRLDGFVRNKCRPQFESQEAASDCRVAQSLFFEEEQSSSPFNKQARSIATFHGDFQPSRVTGQMDASPICDWPFSDAGADIALRSLEGTLYSVRTLMLRSNSGFFNTMFSLPQSEIQSSGHDANPVIPPRSEAILDVYENDFAVKTLLILISGIPVLKWETIDAFECVLQLAEKWDTPEPINFLRSALIAHRFLEHYPLRCYRLATHFNWRTEAKLASSHSLTLDIFNPIHRDTLDHLSSKDLLFLLKLHRKRQIMFREFLNCAERFVAGNSLTPYYCQRCGITELDNSVWRDLKNRMFSEMESRPMGDALNIGNAGWPEAQACWESRCSKRDCRALQYDRSMTLRQIEACIDLLPKTIEYEC